MSHKTVNTRFWIDCPSCSRSFPVDPTDTEPSFRGTCQGCGYTETFFCADTDLLGSGFGPLVVERSWGA